LGIIDPKSKQMEPTLSSTIVPPLLFFIVFFVIFGIVEILLTVLINFLQKKYWVFVVDKLIKARVRYKKEIDIGKAVSIVFVFLIIYITTSFFEVIQTADATIKLLGLILVVLMMFIYFATRRFVERTAIERDLHQYLYFLISIILYVFLMISANTGYETYQAYINRNIVEPAVKSVQTGIAGSLESRVLDGFREEIRAGGCPIVDYNKKGGQGVTHFVYVETDKEFAKPDAELRAEGDSSPLKGRECVTENRYILTDDGKWYQILFQELP